MFIHIWTRFAFLWLSLVVIGGELFQKMEIIFFVIATRLSGKAMCSNTAKQHNCWFLVHNRKNQKWQQALHFLQS